MHGLDNNNVLARIGKTPAVMRVAPPLTSPEDNPISYLQMVSKNRLKGITDRSSLKYNMIVMQILDAAKRSIAEGKRIVL
jgi:hypothetical protein